MQCQCGATTLVAFFILRETYAPILLERKAARLRKETGNNKYQSKMSKAGTPTQLFFTTKFLLIVLFIGQAVFAEAIFFTYLSRESNFKTQRKVENTWEFQNEKEI